MNVMTEPKVALANTTIEISESVTNVPLEGKTSEKCKQSNGELLPPVVSETITIPKGATSVNFCATIYVDSMDPSLKEVSVLETKVSSGVRIINILYNHNNDTSGLACPHALIVTLTDIDPDEYEFDVTLFLVNLDPKTSRGTTTTVKREM